VALHEVGHGPVPGCPVGFQTGGGFVSA
jgi:hypothetical protein